MSSPIARIVSGDRSPISNLRRSNHSLICSNVIGVISSLSVDEVMHVTVAPVEYDSDF
jgi:hypothetical protein